MKQVKDNAGRTWEISINVFSATRVKDILKIDLIKLYENDVAKQLTEDMYLLVNVLYVLCQKQCEALAISDEQFGEALVGDAIHAVHQALLEDVADFFPSSRRANLRKVLSKINETVNVAEAKMSAHIDKLNPTAEIEKALSASMSGNSSTASQA